MSNFSEFSVGKGDKVIVYLPNVIVITKHKDDPSRAVLSLVGGLGIAVNMTQEEVYSKLVGEGH